MSKPTCRELLDADAEGLSLATEDPFVRDYTPLRTLAARVEKVLALHERMLEEGDTVCGADGEDWPCPTVRLLNGEER